MFFHLLLFFLISITLTLNCADECKQPQIEKIDISTQTDGMTVEFTTIQIDAHSDSDLEKIKNCLKDFFKIEPRKTRIVNHPKARFKFYSITYVLSAKMLEEAPKLFQEQINKLKIDYSMYNEKTIITI